MRNISEREAGEGITQWDQYRNIDPSGFHHEEGSSVELGDILFMLSRHKWKIIVLGLAGIMGAAALYLTKDASYQSNAKVLVRYVLERSAIDSELDSSVQQGGRILDEVQILTSWDLAKTVAEAIGPERLVDRNPDEEEVPSVITTKAAGTIAANIEVGNERNSNVISISYKHGNPELVSPVLNELITQYFNKHLEIHRSVGASEFVSEQTQIVKERLEQIEDELNRLKREAGNGVYAGSSTVFGQGQTASSLPDSSNHDNRWSGPPLSWGATKHELLQAETEQAAQIARIKVLEGLLSRVENQAGPTDDPAQEQAPVLPGDDQIQAYITLGDQIAQLQARNASLRQKFPPTNRLIVQNEEQLQPLVSQRRALLASFPVLLAMENGEFLQQQEERRQEQQQEQGFDIDNELAILAAVDARIKVLQERVDEIQTAEHSLPDLLSKINSLQRLKEAEEEKYFYFASSVEKARIDELLDPSKMPNISVVQSASPPVKVIDPKFKKILLGLAGSGFVLGIGLSIFIEMLLDRRIKRSSEFKKRLDLPLMLSIPRLPSPRKNSNRIIEANGAGISEETAKLLGTAQDDQYWPYATAIRDRLFSRFRITDPELGPRLIGMAGITEGSGTSTLSRAVAAMSAASGDRVLLIDINADPGQPNSFHEAKRLLGGSNDPNGKGCEDAPSIVTPRNLYELLPQLQKSEYEYVIFDLPSIDPTSPTYSMAGFMDIILLIVDATKTNREVVKQGYEELVKVNPNLTCIFNKARDAESREIRDTISGRRKQIIDGLLETATQS